MVSSTFLENKGFTSKRIVQEYPEDVFCARENSGEDEGVCFTKK